MFAASRVNHSAFPEIILELGFEPKITKCFVSNIINISLTIQIKVFAKYGAKIHLYIICIVLIAN